MIDIDIKRKIKDRAYRHEAFIEKKEVDRPLLGIHVTGVEHLKAFKWTFKNLPTDRELRPDDIVIKDVIKDIDDFIIKSEKINGDLFYPSALLYYIPWVSAIIGCPIILVRDSLYAKPFIKSWANLKNNVDLTENNKWLSKLIQIKTELINHFDKSYPIGNSVHIIGPADILSSALGQMRFCLELYDNPKKMKKFSDIYMNAQLEVVKILNRITSNLKFGGFLVNIYGLYTKKICQSFQDDSLALLSPKLFKKFILDEFLKINRTFNSTIIHIHPTSLFIVDEILKFDNLKIIQVNRELNGPDIKELLPVFLKIQEHGKSLLIDFKDVDFEADLIFREIKEACKILSHKGLGFCIYAKDVKDGANKLESVKKAFGVY